ncbi:hypothetical protein ATZ36_12795 [Candidatus Endomicrobiellum trichonymphae]|jgi:site-specific DNA-methyltransferase (adenine-specific)|uniref:DNA methylase N-4/N-6 domain-containing protein n=1 Tax=Endomicrobium trichonymphae TaxID=1408204 RepID=A0A1E5IMP7_ENDTX|nr:hypothetical protein ATZ36_12795 [Candidatus Endomicrobium trichonymphae]
MPYSWWYYGLVKNVSKDKTFHSCQIPLGLVKMLIKSSAKENDVVQVLFGESGAELILCKGLGRDFISSELHKPYYDMIIDRLNNDGVIRKNYKLKFGNNKIDYDVQPVFFDSEVKYVIREKHVFK